VYLVRHAEATHNIKEREAVQAALQRGIQDTDQARRAVLQDESLLDAPLSADGRSQVRRASERLNLLDRTKYPPPQIVLVSPLRRVLMTATELFFDATNSNKNPRFVALEALREKRTGYAADERLGVEVLEKEFPHVDFSNLRDPATPTILKGEGNVQVQARGRAFLEGYLAHHVPQESVAIVTHKGWLRELRNTLKEWVDQQRLEVDFDLAQWYQTLYGNAEIRVADFEWTQDHRLTSIVSRSVEAAVQDSGSDSEREQDKSTNKDASLAGANKLQEHESRGKVLNLIESMKLFHFGKKRAQVAVDD
jgi:broad specificity phosphatase PhoE